MQLAYGEGHAAHFLTRLDRLDRANVELALSLYNDVELLLEILHRAKVPASVPRVAIALGPSDRGPYLLVTRDGRFITCLGEGMTPRDHPIVTREQLDGFASQLGELRARIEVCKRVTGSERPSARFLKKAMRAGMNLSREEFVAMSPWARPLRGGWLKVLVAHSARVDRELVRHARTTKVNGANEESLRDLWSSVWATAHLTALLAPEARELAGLLEKVVPAGQDPRGALVVPTMTCFSHGMTGTATRGVYWAARAGKLVLPRFKEIFDASVGLEIIASSHAALTCIGVRHQRLQGEIRKAVAVHPSDDAGWDPLPDLGVEDHARFAPAVRKVIHWLRRVTVTAFDEPDVLHKGQLQLGRPWLREALGQGGAERLGFADEADIPAELAMAALANTNLDAIQGRGFQAMMMMLPWLARAKPEELYLPRNVLDELDVSFRPERVLAFLALQRRRAGGQTPEVVEARPGRNEACSCASGKKYKRCCGR